MIALGVALACSALTREASAQGPEYRRDTTIEESVPNRGLIVSGIALLGSTYAASAVAASVSDYAPDNNLYVPVAGPWLDLAARDDCGTGHAPSCSNERIYDFLLIADGIGQGIGALQVVGGFLFPARRTVTETRASVTVTPTFGDGRVGLQAQGRF